MGSSVLYDPKTKLLKNISIFISEASSSFMTFEKPDKFRFDALPVAKKKCIFYRAWEGIGAFPNFNIRYSKLPYGIGTSIYWYLFFKR